MLDQYKNVFIVGIGGIAMFNVAIILKKMGKKVTGSDSPNIYMTDKYLKENNIPFILSFDPSKVPSDTDLVIYTGAHEGKQNSQVKEAIKRGIKTLVLAEVNKLLTEHAEISIAVCGSHGKTTTASLMAYALKKLDQHPSYLIGTATFNEYFGGDYDGKKYFVIEADEYAVNPPENMTPKFHLLRPSYTICTNIDFDHPDMYSSIEEVKTAFHQFFKNNLAESVENHLIVCADNSELLEVVSTLPRDKYSTYGTFKKADLVISHITYSEEETTFEATYNGEELGMFSISLFGEHNVLNAASVILMLLKLNIDHEKIKSVLKGFTGAKRRFEKRFFKNNTYLFDDYAHQPNEIKATIKGAQERFKNRRVIVIFQSHTFSRTQALKDEFIDALGSADYSFIAPIYPSAREKQDATTISAKDLVTQSKNMGFTNIFSYEKESELIVQLSDMVKSGDVIIMMGAGDIYKIENDIIKVIQNVK